MHIGICYNKTTIYKEGDHMAIETNQELSQAIEQIIDDNGIKKIWLSEKMGISNQNFNRLMSKKSFSLDDANKVLNPIGYHAKITIEKD